jgi:hypothetical protein
VKIVRFSSVTVKMLSEYINTDRRALDPHQRRLEHLADTDLVFSSQRRKPYDYEAFNPHWYALRRVVQLDLNIHSLRHWYVTQAIRHICETAKEPGDVVCGMAQSRQVQSLRALLPSAAACKDARPAAQEVVYRR